MWQQVEVDSPPSSTSAACVASPGGGKHRLAVSASQSNRSTESLHRDQAGVYQSLAGSKHLDWSCSEGGCSPHIRVCLLFVVVLLTGWLSWIEQSPKGAGRFKGHSWLGKWLTEECRTEGAFEEKYEMFFFLPQCLLGIAVTKEMA